MNIAVFTDKFSGTLTAYEVIDVIKENFSNFNIEADFFCVTDGGQESIEIFKSYGFKTESQYEELNCDGVYKNIETLNINKEIYFESAQLIGIDSKLKAKDINSSSLTNILNKVQVLGTGGSKTIDFGIGILSSLGMEFISNGETIADPKPKDFPFIDKVNASNFDTVLNLTVLSDTQISLLGNNSCFDIFGPQKGLSSADIQNHKQQVERLIGLIETELKVDLNPQQKSSGAAGGLTFTLNQILGCEVLNGPEYFLKQTGLLNKLNQYDIGIFCEGKFDESSLEGKIIGELLSSFEGSSYFLGGQYKAEVNYFTNIFECGAKGIEQPRQYLSEATKELIKTFQKD
jgi:glycerate kinase